MIITESHLKQIISEELQIMLVEEQFRQGLITEAEFLKKLKQIGKKAIVPLVFTAMAMGLFPATAQAGKYKVSAQHLSNIQQKMDATQPSELGDFVKSVFERILKSDGTALFIKVSEVVSKGGEKYTSILVGGEVEAPSPEAAKKQINDILKKYGYSVEKHLEKGGKQIGPGGDFISISPLKITSLTREALLLEQSTFKWELQIEEPLENLLAKLTEPERREFLRIIGD